MWKLKISLLTFLLFLFINANLFAQDEPYFFKDYNYVTNVKSVKFYNADLDLSYPFVDLENGYLTLDFDDIDGDVKDFQYKIILCDRDWKPSDLSYFEYVERFDEADVENYEFSFGTLQSYTSFRLKIPNQDVKWTKSGNYLLVVFEEDIENPIITRRFVVVEPVVTIRPQIVKPTVMGSIRTHHEIDFNVDHQGVDLRNPRGSIRASILQNGRWDNAIMNLSPFNVGRSFIDFDHLGKIVFPAGREWRFVDLRGFDYPVPHIKVVEDDDGFFVTVNKDHFRSLEPHTQYRDLNGSFILETTDYPRLQAIDSFSLSRPQALRAEYGNILFSLNSKEFETKDVYMFGEFTNWEIHNDFKMKFNPAVNGYISQQYLKQGYYNYSYALVDKETKKVDFSDTEGNWFETDNAYSILIYYRPIGARYDRVIGGYSFYSSFRKADGGW